MNNKIALCGDAEKRRQTEDVLSKFLNENDIPFEIHRVSTTKKLF